MGTDIAQQYEAFEFLEAALADPVHFLEFCPVHLTPRQRRDFVRRYYSLDNSVVREILRTPNSMQIRWPHQGGGRKDALDIAKITKESGEKTLKVQRTPILNWVKKCAPAT